jgi:hypothetical protein
VLSTVFSQSQPGPAGGRLEQFGFVVGEWSGTSKGYPTPRSPKAFESPAQMTSRWGPQHAWIDSEATTAIPGVGPYHAKVVVGFDGRTQTLDSFVINTFGNAGRYSGTMSGNQAIFIGKVGDITQRVTYVNVSNREMRFMVEESHDDGATYQPHSEILWRRR